MEIPDMSDFQMADQGTIFLIRPLNEAARQWLDENVVSEPWQWVQGALCTVGFTINLSANNPAEADALADLRIGPVVTVVAHDYARRAVRHRAKSRPDEWAETIAQWRDRIARLPVRTPAGRRIAICPATYTDATCKSCGACAEPHQPVIGFPAHGPWRIVEQATAARDVAVGQSWAFREHRTMAEVIADEKLVTA
jgi:hypothetical protein